MNFSYIIASEETASQWDAIVENSPSGTLFHTWKWLRIAEKYSGSTLYPLIFFRGEEPIGLVPLFYQTRYHLRMVFSPPPHLALLFLGPIISGKSEKRSYKIESAWIELQKQMDIFIEKNLKPHYVSISSAPGISDVRPYRWAGYHCENAYDYVSDIGAGVESIWQNLQKNFRQDINRSKKLGISIETGGEKELEIIYDSLVQRYREQGRPVKVPKQYLIDLYRSFPDNIRIFVAKHEGNIVTGSIELVYKNGIGSWIGNAKPLVNITPSPNGILLWEIIKYAIENGYKEYLIYGAAGNERLYVYWSSKFNPQLQSRFVATKASVTARLIESGYTYCIKPVSEKIRSRLEE
jgi:hypothetical protein